MSDTQIILWIAFILGGYGWVQNLVALSECDFEAPYKAEVLRGVGLVPPIGAVMGYLDIEDK